MTVCASSSNRRRRWTSRSSFSRSRVIEQTALRSQGQAGTRAIVMALSDKRINRVPTRRRASPLTYIKTMWTTPRSSYKRMKTCPRSTVSALAVNATPIDEATVSSWAYRAPQQRTISKGSKSISWLAKTFKSTTSILIRNPNLTESSSPRKLGRNSHWGSIPLRKQISNRSMMPRRS